MTALTIQAALSIAVACAPSVDPHMIVAIGQHESGLDPLTIHDNTAGRLMHGERVSAVAAQLVAAGHSVDLGLMQINSANLGMLGLPLRDAFEACQSMEAAAKLLALFSKYNTGSPARGIANGYAMRVMAMLDNIRTGRVPEPAGDRGQMAAPTQRPAICERPIDVWASNTCAATDQDDFVHHYDGENPHE
jgi:type IV secretion system protein VirB1